MLSKIKQFLNQPFPEQEGWNSYLRSILLISVFVTVFLYFFKPFNIDQLGQHQFLICLGFGVINLLVCIAYRVATVWVGVDHQSKQWTLGKWVLNTLGLIVIIGLVNYLFVAYLGGMQFQ